MFPLGGIKDVWFVDNITINLVQPSSRKSLLVEEFSENLKYALLHLKVFSSS